MSAATTTLFLTTSSGGIICLSLLLWRSFQPLSFENALGTFPDPSAVDLLLIFSKSCLVSCSWFFAYLSLKHLPLSLVAPIRGSGPLWTLFIAWFAFSESPNLHQLLAFFLTLLSYLWFTFLSHKGGFKISRNPWVLCIILGTCLGSLSAIYDKWLIQIRGLDPVSIQLHFSVGMMIFQGGALLFIQIYKKEKSTFQWRWSIPFVGVALLFADALYFHALSDPEALVSLVSAIRRGSLLVSFFLSWWILKEVHAKGKTLPVIGVLTGLIWLGLSG